MSANEIILCLCIHRSYPNVGKSSIINSLKRARAVGVSPRPGFTTSMQEVVLDKNIRLLDSPGVVFDDDDGNDGADVLLRNCVDADSISDPVAVIKTLLGRCSQRSLLMAYAIPAFPPHDENIFLGMIAKKYGKVLKGGVPDKVAAARTVLRDWNCGKVPFYTPPPTNADSHKTGMEQSAKIVSAFGNEFDVTQMEKYDAEMINSLEDKDPMDFVEIGYQEDHEDELALAGDMDQDDIEKGEEEGDCDEEMDASEGSDDEEDDHQAALILPNSDLAEAEDYDFGDL